MKKTVCFVIILVLLMVFSSYAYADTANYRGRCMYSYSTASLTKKMIYISTTITNIAS